MPSSGKKKNTGNRTTKTTTRTKSAPSGKKTSTKYEKRESQIIPIILFFVSILLFLFALIPGKNVWNDIYNVLHGLFGFVAYLVPLYIMVITVFCAFKKLNAITKLKFIGVGIMLWCLAAFIDVFHNHNVEYLKYIIKAYENEMILKGGIFGAIIGWPFQNWFGVAGASIILALLVIVLLLITTGTTLVQFINTMRKPAQKVKQSTSEMIEKRREAEVVRKRSFEESMQPFLEGDTPTPKNKTTATQKREKLIDTYVEDDINEDIIGGTEEDNTGSTIDDIISKLQQNDTNQDVDILDPKASLIEKEKKKLDKEESENNLKEFEKNLEKEEKFEVEYVAPTYDLLDSPKESGHVDIGDELKSNADLLINTLRSFGIEAKIIDISRGPSITRYELQPAAGVKISKITNLSDDIALALATSGVRIEAPIPNKAAIGIEVPNKNNSSVLFREIIESKSFVNSKSKLSVGLGMDITGNVIVADISKMPHVLVAGTTGAGKSVCVNSMIMSILYKAKPEEVKMLMIDPKVVELQEYNGIPHLLVPVVTDPRKAASALGWTVTEMLRRYNMFAECNVRDIASYNSYVKDFEENDEDEETKRTTIPHIVIIIDELSDLMMAAPNEVEDSICRIAQMGRAAGMHLVVATQRPSVNVITGLIKANIPSRIALKTSNGIDSRTIIDTQGAEKLLGKGDMLFFPVGANKPVRVQGCWVSPQEIEKVINFLKKDHSADYSDKIMDEISNYELPEKGKKVGKSDGEDDFSSDDELLEDAIECVIDAGIGSVSLLQRKLRVGHSRSGFLMDIMEERGIVGPYEGSKPRKVLISKQQWYEMKNSGVHETNEE